MLWNVLSLLVYFVSQYLHSVIPRFLLVILCVRWSHMHSVHVCTSIGKWIEFIMYYVFSQYGNSPLHDAAYWGEVPIVKLLIQNGASSTQCNNVSVIVKQVIHVPLCAHV